MCAIYLYFWWTYGKTVNIRSGFLNILNTCVHYYAFLFEASVPIRSLCVRFVCFRHLVIVHNCKGERYLCFCFLVFLCDLLAYCCLTVIFRKRTSNVKDEVWLCENKRGIFFQPHGPSDSYWKLQKTTNTSVEHRLNSIAWCSTIFNVISIKLVSQTHLCSDKRERETTKRVWLFFIENINSIDVK